MRSFRVKPVGWRGESHRHYLASKGIASKMPKYLAAKGVKSKYFSPVVRGKDLPVQRHHGSKKFDDKIFEKSGKKFDLNETVYMRKPRAPFWTSSVKESGKTDWEDWTDSEEFKQSPLHFDVVPDEDAKVFVIDDEADIEELFNKYGGFYDFKDGSISKLPKGKTTSVVVDWNKVAEDFDGVRVTEDAVHKFHLEGPQWHGDSFDLNIWDAESTAWFKKRFKEKVNDEKL